MMNVGEKGAEEVLFLQKSTKSGAVLTFLLDL